MAADLAERRNRVASAARNEAGVIDAGKGFIRVVMTTDAPVGGIAEEDGDIVDQSTYSLDRWIRTGAQVLEGHYSGPGICGGPPADVVGVGSQHERTMHDGRDAHLTTVRWDLKLERGAILDRQYREDIRRCFSIGFLPRAAVKRTSLAEGDPYRVDPEWARETGRPGGRLLRNCVQLELSPVTVPADEHATTARGIDDLTWGDRIEAMVSRLDERGLERVAGLFGRALGVPAVRDAVIGRLLADEAFVGRLALAVRGGGVPGGPSHTMLPADIVPEADPWVRALASAWRGR